MQGLKYVITITKRDYAEQFLDFFRQNEINRVMAKLCSGTATDSILDVLGIEATEKVMFEAIVREEAIKDLKRGFIYEMDIGISGNGVVFILPIQCVGGMSSVKYFAGEKPLEKTEETKMSETNKSLIITIVDKGNTDIVMEAARGAGASGGTVVKAKGTGADIAKFFGVSISEEKEMVYIATKKEMRDGIMRAIMEKAGTNTDAHGVVFSLPVDSVLGIRSLEEI